MSDLRQGYLIGATEITSATPAARKCRNVPLTFVASLVQEEMLEGSKTRCSASQPHYLVQGAR